MNVSIVWLNFRDWCNAIISRNLWHINAIWIQPTVIQRTVDPFTYLSLPLPMESSVHIDIIVIRQDGTVPIKYGLTMDMEARYSSLKTSLSHLCQIPTENLILVDIVQSQFRVSE